MGGIRSHKETEDMFIRTGQHDRIIPLAESVDIIRRGVESGKYKLVRP